MKNLFWILVNMLVFWAFVNAMPGLDSPKGPIGLAISGFFYGLVIAFLPNILKFFKFPVNFWGKFLIGTLLTLLLLSMLNFLITGIISFGPGYIGGSDFIIFTIPRLVNLPNAVIVIIVSAVLLVLCSIMLESLSKKKD
jgi:hypothetical protein